MAEHSSTSVPSVAAVVEVPAKVTEAKTVVATPIRKDKLVVAAKKAKTSTMVFAKTSQEKCIALIRNPHFQVVTLNTALGTVTLGAVGGAFGCMGGVLVGGVTGCLPALFTFGLSIPFGAVAGATLGTATGSLAGGFTGALTGGATSHGCYVYRAQIRNGFLQIRMGTSKRAQILQVSLRSQFDRACEITSQTKANTRLFLTNKASKVQSFATNTKQKGVKLVTDRSVQVAAASAAAGGLSGGLAGGALGTAAGVGAGALVGIPTALFTFGLSIPVCATIGGGLGCVTGTATGTAAGGLVSGATGYTTHRYKHELTSGVSGAWNCFQTNTNRLKVKAMDSVTQVTAMVSGTGGTPGGAGSE